MDWIRVPEVTYALRLLASAAAAALVGVEREAKGKPAGLRTNILICVGSCLLMILSMEIAEAAGQPADPGRIAAQVVTGVGFLGAGMIMRSRVTVRGLTSAATVWFVAAVGLVIGSGNYILGFTATLLMLLTLSGLERVERSFEVRNHLHLVRLRVDDGQTPLRRVRAALTENRVSPDKLDIRRTEAGVELDVEYVGLETKHKKLMQSVQALDGVKVLVDY